MALHPVQVPESARELRRIVAMQRLLLKALCVDPLEPGRVDQEWLCKVWKTQEPDWVRRFCRTRTFCVLEPIRALAGAPLQARKSIHDEFCLQNRVRIRFEAGGDFRVLTELPGVTEEIAKEVHRLFSRFYEFLGHETGANWNGYEFAGNRAIRRDAYVAAIEATNAAQLSVCPYCDGSNDEPELDHYYPKETYPLLSCSPWNLVGVCHHCNKLGAKQGRVALTVDHANPADAWLHPFFRPASLQTQIRITGTPSDPNATLQSPNPVEQQRLKNHSELIPTLSKRWRKIAVRSFGVLVAEINARIDAQNTVASLVQIRHEDHLRTRGRSPDSLIHAAVCQAVLDGRPGYIDEFAYPNAPVLALDD